MKSLLFRRVVPAFVLLMPFMLAVSVFAQEAACDEELPRAEASYLNGEFGETIAHLTECLSRGEPVEDEAVAVYRLLTLAHFNRGEIEEARRAVVKLLSIRPDYQADAIQDPPGYTSLVAIVRQQLRVEEVDSPPPPDPILVESRPGPSRRRTWIIVGAGAVVAGVVGAVVASGSGGGGTDGPPALPLPPSLP
jgi:hypothetical protein